MVGLLDWAWANSDSQSGLHVICVGRAEQRTEGQFTEIPQRGSHGGKLTGPVGLLEDFDQGTAPGSPNRRI